MPIYNDLRSFFLLGGGAPVSFLLFASPMVELLIVYSFVDVFMR
jgi:hypothetical protein